MRELTWDEYYGSFYDWAESTQISYLSGLRSFGPSHEVCEIAREFTDEKAASRLIRKAVAAGTKFTAAQVMELSLLLDRDALGRMAETVTDRFSRDQLEELYGAIGDDAFERIAKRSRIDIFAPDAPSGEERSARGQSHPKRGKLSAFFLALGLAFLKGTAPKSQKKGEHCDGDCANCPPHYGYRYGRWYYGHGHTEGCQRGGNRGGAGHL